MEKCNIGDKERIREVIMDELGAINKYERYANDTDVEEFENIIRHIVDDEKSHVSEMMLMLERCDEKQKEFNIDMHEHFFNIVGTRRFDVVEFIDDKIDKLNELL